MSVVAGGRGSGPGSGQRGVDRGHRAVRPDQPSGGALHRPGRAGAKRSRRGWPRARAATSRPRPRETATRDGAGRGVGQRRQRPSSARVIEVDERTGTARLRREVAAADEMALDARSTRTARVRKEERLMPTCIEGHTSVAEDYCDVCGSPIGNRQQHSRYPPPRPRNAPHAGRRSTAGSVNRADTTPLCRNRHRTNPRRRHSEPACGPRGRCRPGVLRTRPRPRRPRHGRVPAASSRNAESPCNRHRPDRKAQPRPGRAPEIDLGLQPADRGVSTQHAVLRIRDSGPTITDLGSTNGTSLNGSEDRLANGEETPLADGDRIHVGAWTTIKIVKDAGNGP